MKRFSPNWIWFLSAFVIALCLAGWQTLLNGENRLNGALQALWYFPVGIENALTWNTSITVMDNWVFIILTFMIYAGLMVFGSFRKSWTLWSVFVALLLVNITGCQLLWSSLGTKIK